MNTLSYSRFEYLSSFRKLPSAFTIAEAYGKNFHLVDSDLPIGFVMSNPLRTQYYYEIALRPAITYKQGKYSFNIYLSKCEKYCLGGRIKKVLY